MLILGGINATKNEFPWHAAIFVRNASFPKWRYKCGGVLLSSTVVLTVAHCLKDIVTEKQTESTCW